MLSSRSIVCFSSIDWDAAWQIHQEVMGRFARAGNRVLFVENTGVRRPTLRDLSRLGRRVRRWRSAAAPGDLPPGLRLVSPMIPPFPYSRLALPLKHALLGRSVRRNLRELGMARPIVWVFLPTPVVVRLAAELDPSLIVYHCADDFAASSPLARPIEASEAELLRHAHVVFATSASLAERLRKRHPHVHLMPTGVAFEEFERIRRSDAPLPPDIEGLPRPIVGYVGGVNERLDDTLIVDVARRLPSFSFVFVGPVRAHMTRLARTANVHLLGRRSHDEIPRYIKGFDAGMIPYRLTPFTHAIFPVKLNEYLAMGVPVVATGVREVRRFIDEHPRAAAIAASADAFAAAIERAVGDRDRAARAQRIDIARTYDWAGRMELLSEIVDARLADAARAEPGA